MVLIEGVCVKFLLLVFFFVFFARLLDLLEVLAPEFKHFGRLRDFINFKLPPGFPVKLGKISCPIPHSFLAKMYTCNEI